MQKEEKIVALFDELNSNSRRTIREGVDLATMEYKSIREFVGNVIQVDGFFFTDGKFGKQVVVVGNGCKINLPSREVEKFERIEENEAMLKGLLEGHLRLSNIKEVATRNGTTTIFKYETC